MKQINELWRDRIQAYITELRRYLKYMFNDHLLFVLIFGGGAAIYYYSQWVRTLDQHFPIALVMAVLFAFVLVMSPAITLLKQADIVFLLPLEKKLKTYFRNGLLVSFLSQAYIILIVLALCMPMYVQVTGNGFKWFFYYLLILLGLKGWNLSLHWAMLKFPMPSVAFYDWIIRFAINGLLVYFLIQEASYWFIGGIVLIGVFFTLYVNRSVKNKRLLWEKLIEREQARMETFYRAANMFTDVPHLRGKVKRRKWLDRIIGEGPYASSGVYQYLFTRTLVRSSEYSGLIIRLTLIPFILIVFVDSFYFTIALALLFIYLTGFQLLPMVQKHDLKIWTSLYPIRVDQKSTAFLRLMLQVSIVQSIIFGIGVWLGHDFLQGVIIFGLSLAFSIIFVKVYIHRRLKKLTVI